MSKFKQIFLGSMIGFVAVTTTLMANESMPISTKIETETLKNWAQYHINNCQYEIEFIFKIIRLQEREMNVDDYTMLVLRHGEIEGYENLILFLEEYEEEMKK